MERGPSRLRRAAAWIGAHRPETACVVAMLLGCWGALSPAALGRVTHGDLLLGDRYPFEWIRSDHRVVELMLLGSGVLLALAGSVLGPGLVWSGWRRAGWILGGLGLACTALVFAYPAIAHDQFAGFGLYLLAAACAMTIATFAGNAGLRERQPQPVPGPTAWGASLAVVLLVLGGFDADPVGWTNRAAAGATLRWRLPGWQWAVGPQLRYLDWHHTGHRGRAKLAGGLVRDAVGPDAHPAVIAWRVRHMARNRKGFTYGETAQLARSFRPGDPVLSELLQDADEMTRLLAVQLAASGPVPSHAPEVLRPIVDAAVAAANPNAPPKHWYLFEWVVIEHGYAIYGDDAKGAYDALAKVGGHWAMNSPGTLWKMPREALLAQLDGRPSHCHNNIYMALEWRAREMGSDQPRAPMHFDALSRSRGPARAKLLAELAAWARAHVPQ